MCYVAYKIEKYFRSFTVSRGDKMNWKFTLAAIAATAFTLSCVRGKETKGASLEEKEIKEAQRAYIEAFNKKNPDSLASLWTEEANYLNLTTKDSLEGKAQIAKYFTEEFQKNEASQIDIKTEKVQVHEPDSVEVKGTITLTSKEKPQEKSTFIADYIKLNGSWLLDRVREIELILPPSRYEKLKELEWLVGEWKDGDENVDINLHCSWDKNKNFLVQHFDMKILGVKDLGGTQYITWDPDEKKICSWIFDSDGGFGRSIWNKDDGNWYVTMTFTLPDGRKSSATNIYKKVDDTTYTFSSCSRDIDGKVMPNIGPFTVTKEKGVQP
jgi:uncharacterized protein (TIGR02246 family)